mgnify:CR=1 FL=1
MHELRRKRRSRDLRGRTIEIGAKRYHTSICWKCYNFILDFILNSTTLVVHRGNMPRWYRAVEEVEDEVEDEVPWKLAVQTGRDLSETTQDQGQRFASRISFNTP